MSAHFTWSARIVHGNGREAWISRVRRGRGFAYVGPDGATIRDQYTRARIAAAAIPPAWENVKIASDECSHLQAVGFDQRHRLQYRYHPLWIQRNKLRDFDRLPAFGRALPKIRRFIDKQLRRRQMDKDRVLGIALHLLDASLIRVGNDRYANENHSFGLTTLHNTHVKADQDGVHFDFIGKGGTKHKFSVADPRAARAIRACHELPGYRLLQYIDETGQCQPLSSTDINHCLAELTGAEFTAKTFRTWGATTDFCQRVYGQALPGSEHGTTLLMNEALKATAKVLGNTLAVCRKYYVHPRMLEGFASGALAQQGRKLASLKGLSEAESDALRFLERRQ